MNRIKKIGKIMILILLIIAVAAEVFIIKLRYDQTKENQRSVVIPVLLYHDFVEEVPDSDPYDYAYMNTPDYLEENLCVLLDHGYTPISFEELYNAVQYKTTLPDKPIIITFDDGNIGQYTLAYPILKNMNVKSTIFVVMDLVGTVTDGVEYFGWSQAIEMENSGLVDIYSHNLKHIFLDRISVADARAQVYDSFDILDKKLKTNPLKVFAYPYGATSTPLVAALEEEGIKIQVYDIGINRLDSMNLSYVKRINIPYSMEGLEILDIIDQESK